jgi:hypothetical protein
MLLGCITQKGSSRRLGSAHAGCTVVSVVDLCCRSNLKEASSAREMLMVLWTWAKKLEDEFDGANRMNLRHLIGMYELDPKHQADSSTHALPVLDSYPSPTPTKGTYLFQRSGETTPADNRSLAPRKELVRIQTCAIFYKVSEGKGVPHTFVGQYFSSALTCQD